MIENLGLISNDKEALMTYSYIEKFSALQGKLFLLSADFDLIAWKKELRKNF